METGQAEKPKKRWPDRTQTQRTARRRERLNVIARTHGFDTWAKLETAVLNGAGLAVFIAPEAYEVSNGKYYLTTTGNVGLGDFVSKDGVYHLETTSGVDLGEFTPDSLAVIVPIPEVY